MRPSGNVENTHELHIKLTFILKHFCIKITCVWMHIFSFFVPFFDVFYTQIWGCNSDVLPFWHLDATLFSQNATWTLFGRFWARFWLPFGSHLAPIWLPFGSPWLPFGTPWLHFGSLWLLLGALLDPFGTFGEHFGGPTSPVQRATPHVQRAPPHSPCFCTVRQHTR